MKIVGITPISVRLARPTTWEFKQLRDVQLLGEAPYNQARIVYEDDEGGTSRAIYCAGRHFYALEPFAAALLAWREDPVANEQPVIPIADPESDSPWFFPVSNQNWLT